VRSVHLVTVDGERAPAGDDDIQLFVSTCAWSELVVLGDHAPAGLPLVNGGRPERADPELVAQAQACALLPQRIGRGDGRVRAWRRRERSVLQRKVVYGAFVAVVAIASSSESVAGVSGCSEASRQPAEIGTMPIRRRSARRRRGTGRACSASRATCSAASRRLRSVSYVYVATLLSNVIF
jgi:hypothetical protein